VIERELGDKQGSAYSLHYMGSLARARGDYAVARAMDEESLAIRRGLGNPWGIAESLINLGKTALAQRDHTVARDHYAAGLNIKQEIVDKQGIADRLEGFARIASGQANAERAARLYAAAQAVRQRVGVSPVSIERAEYDRDVTAVRATRRDIRCSLGIRVHDDAGAGHRLRSGHRDLSTSCHCLEREHAPHYFHAGQVWQRSQCNIIQRPQGSRCE